jgi:hypothetical protein
LTATEPRNRRDHADDVDRVAVVALLELLHISQTECQRITEDEG